MTIIAHLLCWTTVASLLLCWACNHFSTVPFSGPLLIDTDGCRLGKSYTSCSSVDALTDLNSHFNLAFVKLTHLRYFFLLLTDEHFHFLPKSFSFRSVLTQKECVLFTLPACGHNVMPDTMSNPANIFVIFASHLCITLKLCMRYDFNHAGFQSFHLHVFYNYYFLLKCTKMVSY